MRLHFADRAAGPQADREASPKARCRTAVAVAAVAVFIAGAMTAPVAAETLKQALAAAYRYNPRLDAARATLRATDEEVARANSGYRPTINGTADVGYQNTETKPANANNGETHPRGFLRSL
jgi:outer membrane protein